MTPQKRHETEGISRLLLQNRRTQQEHVVSGETPKKNKMEIKGSGKTDT